MVMPVITTCNLLGFFHMPQLLLMSLFCFLVSFMADITSQEELLCDCKSNIFSPDLHIRLGCVNVYPLKILRVTYLWGLIIPLSVEIHAYSLDFHKQRGSVSDNMPAA